LQDAQDEGLESSEVSHIHLHFLEAEEEADHVLGGHLGQLPTDCLHYLVELDGLLGFFGVDVAEMEDLDEEADQIVGRHQHSFFIVQLVEVEGLGLEFDQVVDFQLLPRQVLRLLLDGLLQFMHTKSTALNPLHALLALFLRIRLAPCMLPFDDLPDIQNLGILIAEVQGA
jgi:hypothetical protein